MAITINNFEIVNQGTQLAIDVETNVGSLITNIDIWKMDDFKDTNEAINLNAFLENVNNKEILLINANDVGVYKFTDIVFMEVTSNFVDTECSECSNPVLGITYNLSPYYTCLLNYLLDLQLTQCVNCNEAKSKDMVITLNMLLDNIVKCIDVAYYTQAIEMVHKLQKLCSLKTCTNCPSFDCPSCSNFIQV